MAVPRYPENNFPNPLLALTQISYFIKRYHIKICSEGLILTQRNIVFRLIGFASKFQIENFALIAKMSLSTWKVNVPL